MRNTARILGAAILFLLGASNSQGAIVSTLPGGSAAQAEFIKSGTTLTITLRNTGTDDALVNTDVLTGVFFDLAGDPTLTRVSAITAVGSPTYLRTNSGFTNIDPDGSQNVSSEWAFRGPGLPNNPFSGSNPAFDTNADYGISSSGLSLFGPNDLFDPPPPPDLSGPDSPDGVQYGIAPAGDDPSTGQGNQFKSDELTKNSVVFTFTIDSNYVLTQAGITHVYFQYGTGLGEPRLVPFTPSGGALDVPEPASLAIWMLGVAGVGLVAQRRRKQLAAA